MQSVSYFHCDTKEIINIHIEVLLPDEDLLPRVAGAQVDNSVDDSEEAMAKHDRL